MLCLFRYKKINGTFLYKFRFDYPNDFFLNEINGYGWVLCDIMVFYKKKFIPLNEYKNIRDKWFKIELKRNHLKNYLKDNLMNIFIILSMLIIIVKLFWFN